MSADTQALATDIKTCTGIGLEHKNWREVGGGDINRAFRVRGQDGSDWFLKLNSPAFVDQFAAEAEGLEELARADDIRIPQTGGYGDSDSHAWLLLEWLNLGSGDVASGGRLGEALAAMHRISRPDFGWHRDNSIGATPQLNEPANDWAAFYAERRLRPQLELAADNGARKSLLDAGYELLGGLQVFFADYQPEPALLHGDLWAGNWGALADGTPALFDPAVYYGDRETDIAMTRLFGGFPDSFYSAYAAAWPLDPGYSDRQSLYNLYHVLNHFNLFGGGYAAQAEGMLGRLLSQI